MPIFAARTSPTPRQREILAFIRECIGGGMPPTYREIGERFGIHSPNGVRAHLTALRRKGFITSDARKSRGLRLTDAGRALAAGEAS